MECIQKDLYRESKITIWKKFIYDTHLKIMHVKIIKINYKRGRTFRLIMEFI